MSRQPRLESRFGSLETHGYVSCPSDGTVPSDCYVSCPSDGTVPSDCYVNGPSDGTVSNTVQYCPILSKNVFPRQNYKFGRRTRALSRQPRLESRFLCLKTRFEPTASSGITIWVSGNAWFRQLSIRWNGSIHDGPGRSSLLSTGEARATLLTPAIRAR